MTDYGIDIIVRDGSVYVIDPLQEASGNVLPEPIVERSSLLKSLCLEADRGRASLEITQRGLRLWQSFKSSDILSYSQKFDLLEVTTNATRAPGAHTKLGLAQKYNCIVQELCSVLV
jgi:hypothetical protein